MLWQETCDSARIVCSIGIEQTTVARNLGWGAPAGNHVSCDSTTDPSNRRLALSRACARSVMRMVAHELAGNVVSPRRRVATRCCQHVATIFPASPGPRKCTQSAICRACLVSSTCCTVHALTRNAPPGTAQLFCCEPRASASVLSRRLGTVAEGTSACATCRVCAVQLHRRSQPCLPTAAQPAAAALLITQLPVPVTARAPPDELRFQVSAPIAIIAGDSIMACDGVCSAKSKHRQASIHDHH